MSRRALELQLALIAYQLDHGAYPRELAQLVPDYVDRLPHDPFSGELFWYRPEGFDVEFESDNAWTRSNDPGSRIPVHTPILWSVGHRAWLRSRIGIVLGGAPEATSEPSGKESGDVGQRQENTVYFYDRGAFIFRLPKPADSE